MSNGQNIFNENQEFYVHFFFQTWNFKQSEMDHYQILRWIKISLILVLKKTSDSKLDFGVEISTFSKYKRCENIKEIWWNRNLFDIWKSTSKNIKFIIIFIRWNFMASQNELTIIRWNCNFLKKFLYTSIQLSILSN